LLLAPVDDAGRHSEYLTLDPDEANPDFVQVISIGPKPESS
jgi:hypothetical protein